MNDPSDDRRTDLDPGVWSVEHYGFADRPDIATETDRRSLSAGSRRRRGSARLLLGGALAGILVAGAGTAVASQAVSAQAVGQVVVGHPLGGGTGHGQHHGAGGR